MMFQRQRKTKRQLQTKEQETFSFPLGCPVKHIEDAVESVPKPSILADCRPSFVDSVLIHSRVAWGSDGTNRWASLRDTHIIQR